MVPGKNIHYYYKRWIEDKAILFIIFKWRIGFDGGLTIAPVLLYNNREINEN